MNARTKKAGWRIASLAVAKAIVKAFMGAMTRKMKVGRTWGGPDACVAEGRGMDSRSGPDGETRRRRVAGWLVVALDVADLVAERPEDRFEEPLDLGRVPLGHELDPAVVEVAYGPR